MTKSHYKRFGYTSANVGIRRSSSAQSSPIALRINSLTPAKAGAGNTLWKIREVVLKDPRLNGLKDLDVSQMEAKWLKTWFR